jgi:hypothetical protein
MQVSAQLLIREFSRGSKLLTLEIMMSVNSTFQQEFSAGNPQQKS